MSGSLHLGRVLGIDVRMHWTFIVLMLVLVQLSGPSFAVLLVLVFGSVFLHELGHSVVAQRHGIRVLDITFWPLGGMARMSEIPEDGRVEARIAIAGPAVNFALAALGLVVLALAPAVPAGGGLFGLAADPRAGQGPVALASWFVEINLVLGIFNLVPAFPMDGGRILRAFLALRRPWLQATELAVSVGRQLALATLLASVVACPIATVSGGSFPFTLPLIAGFVWFAGGRELWAVRLRELQRRQRTHQSIFDLFRSPGFGQGTPPPSWGPFETDDEEPRGPRDAAAAAEVEVDAEVDVEPEPDAGHARRPADWEGELDGGRGFTDDDVRRLERYRGRLPRGRAER